MKKLLIILILAASGCTNAVETEQQARKHEHEAEHTGTAATLNNTGKWKADKATKKNVAAMMQVMHDSSYVKIANKEALYAALQTKVDTLINECRMKGADHDALHVWLEKVLGDMKELKKGGDDYNKVYAALKNDIDSLNTLFE